jgi:3-oxoacyl-[acyl-carrier protein] reductase
MAGSLDGRVAIVTGGGRGMGEGICHTLGAAVAAVDAVSTEAQQKHNKETHPGKQKK